MAVTAEGRDSFVVAGTGPAYSHYRSKHFGEVVAVGSGRESIVQEVRGFDEGQYGLTKPLDDDQWPEFSALAHNLVVLGHVYWKEFAASFTSLESNIFSGWGGAYDCVYRDSHGVLRHLESYTVLLRLLDVDQQGNEPDADPTHVLKYERRDDVSVVATTDGQGLNFFGARDITASGGPEQITVGGPDFTMNSKVHVVVTAVLKDGKFRSPWVCVEGLDPNQAATPPTVFTRFDDDGRLLILIQKEFDNWLTEQILNHVKGSSGG